MLLAFVVVIHHSFPLRMGAWAVGMFFVLSGFWISRMWRASYSQKPSPYQTFLISRWWRIAPLFVAVQAIAAAFAITTLSVDTPSAINEWRWWVTQPLVIGSTQFDRLLPPSWSLDVEMQFYLIAPFVVAGFARIWLGEVGRRSVRLGTSGIWRNDGVACAKGSLATSATREHEGSLGAFETRRGNGSQATSATGVLVLGGLIGWCVWRLTHGASLETPSLDIFAWLFAVGVVCELTNWKPTRTAAIGSAGLLLVIVLMTIGNPETRGLVWVVGSEPGLIADDTWKAALFFVLTTLVALPFAIRTVHQPSSTWDRWLGDLSFPLYLVHWLPRDWYYANVDWSLGPIYNGGLLLANFAMAFVGAIILLQLIDRPVQRKRQRWVRGRVKPLHVTIDESCEASRPIEVIKL